MMKRRKGNGATVLVFPVVFNLLFFLLKPDFSQVAVWVNYAAIHAAYVLLAIRPKDEDRQLPLLGLSLRLVCFWYFIYALVAGVALIAAEPDLLWLTLVLQLIPAGLIVLLMAVMQNANQRTEINDTQARQQISFIRINSETLRRAMDQALEEPAKNALERLYTALQASPSKSHESVAALEADITEGIAAITAISPEGAVEAVSQQVRQIMTKLAERNSRLRLMN